VIVLGHLGGEVAGTTQLALAVGVLLAVGALDVAGRDAGVLSRRRRIALWVATCVGLAAVVGPLEQAAHTSFAAHMVQHLVLLLVVAPALVVARADLVVLRTLPSGARRRTAVGSRRLVLPWPVGPALAGLLLAGWLWVAHLPAVYDAQLASAPVHALEHGVWVMAGVALWTPLLRQRPSTARRVLTPFVELVALMPASTVLAQVLLNADEARFAHYADIATAVTDQRVGAGLMWAAMTVVLLGASLVVIGTSEPRRPNEERPRADALPLANRPDA
jgi:cytochrome c oxidase assembly factor CtaG